MGDNCFYFGCESPQRVGHYLFHVGMRSAREDEIDGWPWRWGELDGNYAPGGRYKDKEGRATLTYHMGWTVLAMWDRSGDKRGNSNSAFIARGEFSFAEMVAKAQEHFPETWTRINDRKRVQLLEEA